MYCVILPILLVTLVPTIEVKAYCSVTSDPPQIEFLYVSAKLTFNEAKKRCQDLNYTYLAVLDTQKKTCLAERFLQSQSNIYEDTWIGLNYVTDLGVFHWLDGNEVGWTSWVNDYGEPNYVNTERCVRMRKVYNYDWATKRCSSTYSALCQREVKKTIQCSRNSALYLSSFTLVARDVDTADQSASAYKRSILDCAERCAESCCQYILFGKNACKVLDSGANFTTSGHGTRLYKLRAG